MDGATRAIGRQGRIVVRRLTPLAVVILACAQPGAPPGGPPDVSPPKLVRLRPDSNAVNVRGGSVALEFDEVISERPQGASSLADIVRISPSAGTPNVSWHRSELVVSPKGGLKPNTTYTVQILPGLADLANNVDSTGHTFVFSTGPQIAQGVIAGIVFDWLQARPAPNALVMAIALPDSARYSVSADSSGRFRLTHVLPGRYLFVGVIDQNKNGQRDARELFDSATVTVRDSIRREVLAIVRDSLGPGIANVDARDTLTLKVSFDRALDTAFAITPAVFVLKGADSSALPIRSLRTERQILRLAADSLRAKQVQDSLQRVKRADSIRVADSAKAVAAGQPSPRPTGRRPGVQTAPPPARSDTGRRQPPTPSAQVPSTYVELRLDRPLVLGASFRLHADSLRSITGARRSSDRVFTTEKPKPRTDTTRVKRDTGTARRD
jgi:Big-like domain-containing protein